MLLRFLAFATCLSFCLGFIQELTFYTEPDYGGNSFRFRSKEPDLTQHQFFLSEAKSFCLRGSWRAFAGENYGAGNTLFLNNGGEDLHCRNTTQRTMMSLRYQGPLDITTPSISIYNGTGYNTHGGPEQTYTGLAATNFGFLPKHLVFTGHSNWTAFMNDDFTGNSTCYTNSRFIEDYDLMGAQLRSLVRGCDAKYKSVYHNI